MMIMLTIIVVTTIITFITLKKLLHTDVNMARIIK